MSKNKDNKNVIIRDNIKSEVKPIKQEQQPQRPKPTTPPAKKKK